MTETKRPLKVFLCHSSADKPEVRNWYKRLIADGVDAWLDVESLLPGQKWKMEIPKAIRNSDIVLVCLSKDSINKEGYVQKEIKEALDVADEKPEGMIFIVPARLEDCEVPARLADYQWVDLFKDEGYERLIRALRSRAKTIRAALLPSKVSKIDEVKSKAVELEKRGSLSEALNAYVELRKLKPAYSGVDEKISEIQNKSERRKTAPKILVNNIMGVVIVLVVILALIFGLPSLIDGPEPTPAVTIEQNLKTPTTISVTETRIPELTPVVQSKTKVSTYTPALGVGSTLISDKDRMTLVYIPTGEFLMGSDSKVYYVDDDERPAHNVKLDAYWMYQTEVTNAMYSQCVNNGGCSLPGDVSAFKNKDYLLHPVVYVTWNDANAYCEWAGARLPTEAEWENVRQRTGGGESCSKVNYGTCVGDTKPVGYYDNGGYYGVYDMAGNVWEWVADWYAENYYSVSPASNPMGPDTGSYKVLRGGAWGGTALDLSYTERRWGIISNTLSAVGFRCVVDAE